MRRLIALFALSIILLSACSSQETEYDVPVNFYYPTNPEIYHNGSAAIAPEIREAVEYENDTQALLNLYLKGPVDESFLSIFPEGTVLTDFQTKNAAAEIILSTHFASLSGFELSSACACISMTLFDLCGVEEVCISVQDNLLDGKKQITMTRDMLILYDNMTTQND